MFPSSVALRCHIQIFLRQTRCVMNANVPVFSQNVSGWFLFCAEKSSFTILPFITQSPRGFLIFMLCSRFINHCLGRGGIIVLNIFTSTSNEICKSFFNKRLCWANFAMQQLQYVDTNFAFNFSIMMC